MKIGKAVTLNWRRIARDRVSGQRTELRDAVLGLFHRTWRGEISVVAVLAFSIQETELRPGAP